MEKPLKFQTLAPRQNYDPKAISSVGLLRALIGHNCRKNYPKTWESRI
jgi:hypothetical protein